MTWESSKKAFRRAGIDPVTMSGFIEAGMGAVYTGKTLVPWKEGPRKVAEVAAVWVPVLAAVESRYPHKWP